MGSMQDVPGTGAYENAAVEAAVETLLWSETGDDDRPLDETYWPEDVATDDRRKLREAIAATLETEGVEERITRHNISAEMFGHNFILSANRHGCGFWDRGYGEDGDWLHEMVKPYGELEMYVTRTGLVGIMGL